MASDRSPESNKLSEGEERKKRSTKTLQARADESELIASLRAGDQVAFDELVDEHHAAMVRVALRHVDDYGIAEEVAQETWLAFWNSLGRFRGAASVKTWLFTILLNRARTRGVQEHRRRSRSACDPSTSRRLESALEAPASSSPEVLAGDREVVRAVLSRLPELPKLQREVVTLRDLQGWSSQEVARTLGISSTYQRVLLHRGRKLIRELLGNVLGRRSSGDE